MIKITKDISGLILMLVGLHYFYSYLILSIFFEKLELEFLPIISTQDISLSFVSINYSIISTSLLGFTWIYLWFLAVNDEDRALGSLNNNFYQMKSDLADIIQMKFFKGKINYKNALVIFYLSIFVVVGFIFYFTFFKKIVSEKQPKMLVLLFINFIIMPVLFILFKTKRKYIFIGYIGLIICWGKIFIQSVFEEMPATVRDSVTEIQFEYKNKIISSNDKCTLVFSGYRYIIMANDSTGRYSFYATEDVSHIEYRKVKIRHSVDKKNSSLSSSHKITVYDF